MNGNLISMNIELTTCCPLHCPQCYCTLEGGKHIPLETAKSRLTEAAAHGVKHVQLSGGETMCYPYLEELVRHGADLGLTVNAAFSGWQLTEEKLARLTEAGLGGIFISLNGSTEEINALTRDGYDYAISALELLDRSGFPHTYVNWVMHSNNTADFPNVLAIAERYHVENLVVIAFKPDSHHQLNSFPSADQIREIIGRIKAYRGSVRLQVESCFSQMNAVLRDTRLFGNMNVGPLRGCLAGISAYSVNVDGLYSPCRHLEYFEDWPSLDEYLAKSPVLEKLRHVEETPREPCAGCRYERYCRPCMAVNSKLEGELFKGHGICELWKEPSVS